MPEAMVGPGERSPESTYSFDHLDTNGDGIIDRQEWVEASGGPCTPNGSPVHPLTSHWRDHLNASRVPPYIPPVHHQPSPIRINNNPQQIRINTPITDRLATAEQGGVVNMFPRTRFQPTGWQEDGSYLQRSSILRDIEMKQGHLEQPLAGAQAVYCGSGQYVECEQPPIMPAPTPAPSRIFPPEMMIMMSGNGGVPPPGPWMPHNNGAAAGQLRLMPVTPQQSQIQYHLPPPPSFVAQDEQMNFPPMDSSSGRLSKAQMNLARAEAREQEACMHQDLMVPSYA